MQILVVKDGTIPVLVAKVLATDLGPEFEPFSGVGNIDHDDVELFDVEDGSAALDVSWAEGEGFSVYGTTLAEWLTNRQADEAGGTIEAVAPGHLVQSDAQHGEDENWYSHLFVINP